MAKHSHATLDDGAGWNIDTLRVHVEALRRSDERLENERDRRYSEVNIEREKALKIKEEADKVALDLARQIQTYKDEQANELREQINGERGLYASKEDLVSSVREVRAEISPLISGLTNALEEVKTNQTALLGQVIEMRSAGVGRAYGSEQTQVTQARVIGTLVGLAGLVLAVVAFIAR